MVFPYSDPQNPRPTDGLSEGFAHAAGPLGLLFAQRLRVLQVPSGTVYVPNMAPGLATFLAADLVPDLVPDLFSFGYPLMYAI